MGNIPKRKGKYLTFPISDTMPGPDTYQGVMLEEEDPSIIPAVESEVISDYIGHGTANDIPSTSLAPKPFDL